MYYTKDGITIEYNVQYLTRKSIELRVHSSGTVQLKVPKGILEDQVNLALEKKWHWILKGLEKMNTVNEGLSLRTYSEGECFQLLGQTVKLVVHRHDILQCKVQCLDQELILQVPTLFSLDDFHQLMEAYFKKELKRYLEKRIPIFEKKFGNQVNKIAVRNQKTRWGSCSTQKNINFNYRLIMAPLAVIDYIIVHEMAHLEHMNHSKIFWERVESVMPDYKTHEVWLKKNGHHLSIEKQANR